MVGMMSQGDSLFSRLGRRRRSIGDWALTSSKLRHRDWIGDAILTVAAGLAFVASVFLPWANADVAGTVNHSFSKPAGINGVMATDFGLPVLIAGIAVVVVGLSMLVFGPNRLAVPLGMISAAAALVVLSTVHDAAHEIMPYFDGGLGLVLAFVTAMVLPVIGLASAMVGAILSARARRERVAEAAAKA
jgi:hypothetical protein